MRELCGEAARSGLPLQRPLFLEFPEEKALFAVQDQYLYGSDLLVAPVIVEGADRRDVVLPGNAPWRHCWSGEDFAPGTHTVAAPLGAPPVFYNPRSRHAPLFAQLAEVLQG